MAASISAVSPNVELARQQWEEGYRRAQGLARDPVRYPQLMNQVEVLIDQLRRKVGSTFTLTELAATYPGAERWAYATIEERAVKPGWTRWVTTAVDAAFHLYSRGARDYAP